MRFKSEIFMNFNSILSSYLSKGHERTIKMKKNIMQLFFLRGIGVVISFLLVPITLHYLNPNDYGIWLTLSSIIVWIDFFDVGIGHGLRNKLAEALTNKDYVLAKQYVSTTFVFLCVISLVLFLLFAFINPFLNWGEVLNVDYENGIIIGRIILLLIGIFCFKFIFKMISIILIADQRPAIDSLIGVVGSLLSLVMIFVLTKTTKGSLMMVSIVLSAGPTIVFGFATLFLFKIYYKRLTPSFKDYRQEYLKDLLGLGMKFFIIQLSCLLIFSSSNFIIIHLFGPKEVTAYNIAYKYFYIIIMVFTIIITPLWSAFTEAYVKNDLEWIENTTNSIKKIFFISLFFIVLFVVGSDYFYKMWIGNSVKVPFSVTLSMGIYVVFYNLLSTYNYVVNGVGKVYMQMLISIVSLFIYIPLAILFSKWFGISGAINATTVMLFPLIISAYIQYKKIINNKLSGIWNK